MNRLTPLLLIALVTACADEDAETESTGNAQYVESSQTADEPARPDGFFVEVRAEGTGEFAVPGAECAADSVTGAFTALYEGNAEVNNDGTYVASMAVVEAQPPSGCDVPDLDVALVTDIVVRGEVQATTASCEAYCDSKGAAYADTECEGNADEATCRMETTTTYSSDCVVECDNDFVRMVAETSVTGTALSSLDLQSLSGAALGTITADLTFDRLQDDEGADIDEGPF